MHVSEEHFRDLLSIDDFITASDWAFRLYGRGLAINPPRDEHTGDGFFRLRMSAFWPGHFRSCKVIEETSYVSLGKLGCRRSVLHLSDLRRQTQISIDADFLTDMRTGAAGALGIKYLSRKTVRRVGILGTGRVAAALARSVDRLFVLDRIIVYSRSHTNRRLFDRTVSPSLRTCLELANTPKACLQDVDAILLAVPTPTPILEASAISKDAVIVVMGGDGRTRQLAPDLLESIGIVVDSPFQAQWSGEFRYARETGRWKHVAFARAAIGRTLHIGDAACGRLNQVAVAPRIAYFTGLGIQDLCAAVMVYEKVLTEN